MNFHIRRAAGRVLLAVAVALAAPLVPFHLAASDPGTGDWPMWGGTPDRNMVSNVKGLPTDWDVKTKKNVKWVAQLGSQSYGNPVGADGKVFVGTNNENPRDPKQAGDRGVLMAFRQSDGEFLWQHTHEKLASGRANDWPYQGVASSPLVEGQRVYYVSNRGVVWCLDTNGFQDGKNNGKLVWEDNSVGDRILHGQWSTPSVGKVGGVDMVVSGQGDGWVRGYEAASGKKLWEFDLNPKDSVWPKNRNEVISTPVIYQDRVYIGNGQDPEHGEGVGHFYCIDATKRGDITTTGRVFHVDIRRTIATAAIADGLVYISDFSGFLHALDAKTGQEYWKDDLLSAVWASPMLIDGKIYIGDEDGDVYIL